MSEGPQINFESILNQCNELAQPTDEELEEYGQLMSGCLDAVQNLTVMKDMITSIVQDPETEDDQRKLLGELMILGSPLLSWVAMVTDTIFTYVKCTESDGVRKISIDLSKDGGHVFRNSIGQVGPMIVALHRYSQILHLALEGRIPYDYEEDN